MHASAIAPPEELFEALAACSRAEFYTSAQTNEVPRAPGAYVLALYLKRPVQLDIGSLAVQMLQVGWYVYSGSARGPGGLRARITRHFNRQKTIRWHIDRLSVIADELLAFPVLGEARSECDLLHMLLRLPQFDAPIPGFGSSDCRACPSHLLAWREGQTARHKKNHQC